VVLTLAGENAARLRGTGWIGSRASALACAPS
jgi:hypothetical protein